MPFEELRHPSDACDNGPASSLRRMGGENRAKLQPSKQRLRLPVQPGDLVDRGADRA
jgi:hypothetical protein